MMRELLLLQLAFNVLILASLMVLARTRPSGKRLRKRNEAKRPAKVSARPPAPSRPAAPVPAPAGLESLIEQAERKELIAEAALRQRLERFKARAAG